MDSGGDHVTKHAGFCGQEIQECRKRGDGQDQTFWKEVAAKVEGVGIEVEAKIDGVGIEVDNKVSSTESGDVEFLRQDDLELNESPSGTPDLTQTTTTNTHNNNPHSPTPRTKR